MNKLDLTQFSSLTLKQYKAMLHFRNLSERDRVLDVGCGVGRIAFDVHERTGAIIVGIDKNAEMLTPGKEKFGDIVEYHEMDFSDMRFPHDSFDAIYSIDSLSYAENWESIVLYLIQILKKSGRMAIFRSERIDPEQDPHLLNADQTRLAKLLQKHSLKIDPICFTKDGVNYWKDTLMALEELEEEFRSEGEENLVASLRHEAGHQFSFINDNRYSRYLYLIEKQ